MQAFALLKYRLWPPKSQRAGEGSYRAENDRSEKRRGMRSAAIKFYIILAIKINDFINPTQHCCC